MSPIDTQYFTASTSQARAIACADDFIYATGWAANGADIEVLTVKLEGADLDYSSTWGTTTGRHADRPKAACEDSSEPGPVHRRFWQCEITY